MKTKIVTFSSLMKLAMEAWEKRPDVYKRLVYTGTEQLLPGAWVRFAYDTFELRGPRKKDKSISNGYCNLSAHIRDGRWITRYQLEVSRSKFPARVINTYTPFRFVGHDSKPVQYGKYDECDVKLLNLDGSVGATATWEPAKKGTGDIMGRSHVAIDDEDGLHVMRSDLYAQRCNVEGELNWFPHACYKVEDWLASIDTLPQVDAVKMKDLAMRSLRAAASMVQKIPNAKVRIFNAGTRTVNSSRWAGSSDTVLFKDVGLLDLPEVLLYWRDTQATGKDSTFCYLVWRIIPHGYPGLYPQTGDASIACRPNAGRHKLYHRIQSKAPETPEGKWLGNGMKISSDDKPVGHDPDTESRFADWAKLSEHVQVRKCNVSERIPCLTPGINYAMTPEEAALRIEEAALMESLPVC